jgi:hypothetical protein
MLTRTIDVDDRRINGWTKRSVQRTGRSLSDLGDR